MVEKYLHPLVVLMNYRRLFLLHDEDFVALMAARLSSVEIVRCAFRQDSRNSCWDRLSWGRWLSAVGYRALARGSISI